MFADVSHVALQVPDLQRSLAHYVTVLGLRELERRGEWVFLSHGPNRACVQLREGPSLGLDHIAFVVADEPALGALRARLETAGIGTSSDVIDEPGISGGVRFHGPTDHLFEAVVPEVASPTVPTARTMRGDGYAASGVRPNRLGHITAQTSDVKANTEFITTVLGFRLSDVIGPEPWMVFARCNDDHHALSFMQGRDALHHLAFEVSSVVELVQLGDTLCEAGRTILWGPGRHGAGDNIAIYHQEPSGAIVEYYTDMMRIFDDRWEARVWDLQDYRFNNLWGGPMPDEKLLDAVAPCLVSVGTPGLAR